MLGGPSAEREVSLRSGAAVATALRARGHHIRELDPLEDSWELPSETEVVFLALHGSYGEDGTVQQRLEDLGVPYTGCGVETSRMAFDKVITKKLCIRAGIETPRYKVVESPSDSMPSGWKPPLVLKPVRQGSSVGLEFVNEVVEWAPALARSLQFDGQVLVEERIVGREITVGILAGEVLPIVEVRPRRGAYDYKNKYTAGATEYFCPAEFDAATSAAIATAGMAAFDAVGGRDYGRVDIMVSALGKPVVLEVNTLPGMTETSLLPKAAAAAGISYSELCQKMIDLAMGRKGMAVRA